METNLKITVHICEHCGKEHDGTFGSGKFCSRSCANSRKRSNETISLIKLGVKNMLNNSNYKCKICNRKFKHKTNLIKHEETCLLKLQYRKKLNVIKHNNLKVKINGDEIDKTYGEIDEYRKTHPVCEICGKTVEESIKSNSKFAPRHLCIDHDHSTMKFRGLLCSLCNRQLGWYENNKEQIKSYLEKSMGL